MKFTATTLRHTADQFRATLRVNGVALSWETSFNIWSQMVVGKNFSAAISQAQKDGTISGIPISAERIVALFGEKSRTVKSDQAVEIFAGAIRESLEQLSSAAFHLCGLVRRRKGACLYAVESDRAGLGLFEDTKPGYLPVGKFQFPNTSEDELTWLRASADLSAQVINLLAGVGESEQDKIVFASLRHSSAQEDRVFVKFFKPRVAILSRDIASRLMASFGSTRPTSVDFDEVRDVVYSVIDNHCVGAAEPLSNWLKAHCSTGEAVVDHVTARARDEFQYLTDDLDESMASVTRTIERALEKILG